MSEKCSQCPEPAEPGESLCHPHIMELAHRIMNAEPEPHLCHCAVCGAPFTLIEARVLRAAKDPKAGDHQTPDLCWVCAHLHLSAARPEVCPNCGRDHTPEPEV